MRPAVLTPRLWPVVSLRCCPDALPLPGLTCERVTEATKGHRTPHAGQQGTRVGRGQGSAQGQTQPGPWRWHSKEAQVAGLAPMLGGDGNRQLLPGSCFCGIGGDDGKNVPVHAGGRGNRILVMTVWNSK